METSPEQLEPITSVTPSSGIAAKPPSSIFIKSIRIVLLILIILGIGLLVTQGMWVPRLVTLILKSEGTANIQPSINMTTSRSSHSDVFYTASSTNPAFQTYTNTTLGFAIDIPKTAVSESCVYDSVRGSYEEGNATNTPIVAITKGNTTYIDFEYFYDLVQDPNNLANYSSCVKNDISTYLPTYISTPLASSTFFDVAPISVTILNATSTEAAKEVLLNYYNAYEFKNFASQYVPPYDTSGKYVCNDVTVTPTSNPQVYTMEPCSDDNYQIEYSASAQKIAFIIGSIDGQSCSFAHDYSPNSECYLPEIADSFHFLK